MADRNGFKAGNGPGNSATKGEGKGDLTGTEFADHIMGTKEGADLVDAGAGDDVVIGFAGNDTLEGGAGQDNLSGGAGDDTLIAGSWDSTLNGDGVVDAGGWVLTYDDVDNTLDQWTYQGGELTGDAERDTFDAGSSFADNGMDTILGYQAEDAIDLSSALGGVAALYDLDISGGLDEAEWTALLADGYVSYDTTTGALTLDTDGTAGLADAGNVWFMVSGASSVANGTVYVGETPPAAGAAIPASVVIVIGASETAIPIVI